MTIKQNFENVPVEEDVPKKWDSGEFPISPDNKTEDHDRDWFNTVKGHNLLGWCVGLFVIIYLFELFKNNGDTSKVGETIIEILKLLTFSLSGYLFGTNSNGKK